MEVSNGTNHVFSVVFKGFSLCNKILSATATRFANKKGQISFDDFFPDHGSS